MPFSPVTLDRERDKFVEKPSGETAVRVYVANSTGEGIPIDGAIGVAAPTGPFSITPATISDVSSNPIITPLTNRVSVSIRNLSVTTTVYVGPTSGVTADNTATGGWDVGPGEDLHLDLDDSNLFHMITPATETAQVKIMEIASTFSGGGGGGSSLTYIQEQPTGPVNGINVTYLLSQLPDSAGVFVLFLNGVYQIPGTDYTRTVATVTMTTAPAIGQIMSAFYGY
jgi:hypothetical protein